MRFGLGAVDIDVQNSRLAEGEVGIHSRRSTPAKSLLKDLSDVGLEVRYAVVFGGSLI